MPNRSLPPKYRHYKPKDLAVVRIDGRDHYLGRHGSDESWERYHRLLSERASSGRIKPPAGRTGTAEKPCPGTVSELVLAYWKHAQAYYRKPDGSPSAEQDNIKLALRPLRKLYGTTRADEFGPIALKAVRQALVASGLSRTTINQRVGKIVRVFRWAVENELVPSSAHHCLAAVPGLKKGRTSAPEARPVRPVPDADVEAIKPFVTRQIWALIELQRLTGARSSEVGCLRTCDIDRSVAVWIYSPRGHKTELHGISRRIFLGPRAQEVLRPWLRADPDAFLFQPREAVEEWRAEKRQARKSPLTPSQRSRLAKAGPKRSPGDRYDARAYAHAVERACRRAGVDHWHPHQLRHKAATKIRARYGLEAAQTVLGHARADVTQVYAERDESRAREVMAAMG